jgi:hypothetical protein
MTRVKNSSYGQAAVLFAMANLPRYGHAGKTAGMESWNGDRAPMPVQRRQRTPMPIERVQRWIGASLVFTTLEHLAAGMVYFSWTMDPARGNSNRIGLLVMSGVWGLAAVVAGRLILQKSWLSPWLLLALIWPLSGAYLIYWR